MSAQYKSQPVLKMPGKLLYLALLTARVMLPHAAESASVFPLSEGNQWLLESASDPSQLVKIEVIRTRVWNQQTYYLVHGYAQHPLWLREAPDGRLLARDPQSGQETLVTILDPAADHYATNLDGCPQTARPSAAVTQLLIEYAPQCPASGLVQDIYRPGVGLVQRTYWTANGARVFRIVYARAGGRVTGLRNRTLVFHTPFRHFSDGWLGGFSEYSLRQPNPDAVAELRQFPADGNSDSTGMYLQSRNHAGEMFMFLKRGFSAADGLDPTRSYRLSIDLRLQLRVPQDCEQASAGMHFKAGVSAREPVVTLDADDLLRIQLDKGNPGQDGRDGGIAGTIPGSRPCLSDAATGWQSVQRRYTHPVPVTPNSLGELWFWTGTDTLQPGLTSAYVESITIRLTPEEF